MSRKILLIITIAVLVVAASAMSLYHWHGLRLVQSETTTENGDFRTYTNEEYGFSFEYPKEWGEVRATPELKGFDTGSKVSINFENEARVWINLFSDDYSEGVGEGVLAYYKPEMMDVGGPYKQLYKQLGFVSEEETRINGKFVVVGLGNRRYAASLASVSYLMPYFFENVKTRNIFAVVELKVGQESFTNEELLALRQQPDNQQLESKLVKVLESLLEVE